MPISDLPPPASLWEQTAPPAPDYPASAAGVQTQVAVVGAGYTGLSAALHLAQAGQDVVVIDAHAPGWGASGRNGGQVIAGVKYEPDQLRAMFGAAAGGRMVGTVGGAADLVFDLIDRHAIACDPVRTGWLQPAVSEATLAVLDGRMRQWRHEGADVRRLDQAETARLTGTTAYAGAILDRRGGTVQPLAYARGLAAAAADAGARLFGGTRATALARGGAWRITTDGGDIRADRVILATNGYSGHLHDRLRRSVIAVPSWQVATEPLPPDLRAAILPERQSASDTRRLLRYFRLDAAGRFVLGSRGSFAEPQPDRSVRALCGAARELFPALRGVRFTHHWGGMVAVTRDHLPHLHVLAPGLFAGLGYNGRGVAMATVMGRALASLAQGADPDAIGVPVAPLRPMRLHAASRLGVRATIAWYRLLDARAGTHNTNSL
jgi:glycine/D-amino acid oxidase-like deaminating enzyme